MIHILIVEDNPGDARLIREILSEDAAMFSFSHKQTMAEALSWLSDNNCDIILLDLSLPDSEGLGNIDKVLSLKPTIPVIVLTGRKDRETGLEALRKGAQDFITKGDVELSLLYIKTIQYAIERSKIRNFKDDFLTNVSHELRTPLAIIRETTSQMSDGLCGPTTDMQKKYLTRLLSNVDRLGGLLNDLLDISKIEAGRLDVVKERINLLDPLREVAQNFNMLFQKKGLALQCDFPEEPVEVFADKARLIQVATNLVGNAYKFTEKGKVVLNVSLKQGWVECRVSDTGKGISKEDLPKVFNKFEQFSREYGPGVKGTGLGLVISKNIVEMHGGEISVESVLGEGTAFIFTIPRLSFNEMLLGSLDKCIRWSKKDETSFCLFYLKVNGDISEAHLSEIDHKLKAGLHRKQDLLYRDKNQFYIILPDVKMEDSESVLKRLESLAAESVTKKESLTTSFAIYPHHASTTADLLRHAVKGSVA